jgi:23S rRNA pseudouridine1911/1915/1917 synthase
MRVGHGYRGVAAGQCVLGARDTELHGAGEGHPDPFRNRRQEAERPEPEPLELSVLYEDETLIAVNKPPGMVVHPTYRNRTGTLLNGLLWHVRHRPGITPRIVTRLDKDTSGLVVVALTPEAQARMQKDAGSMKKEYIAVVRGRPEPPSGVISLPLARDSADRRVVVVTPSGQASETRYEVIASAGGRSVVRCELVTGRTHQIRVHLAARGCPILGDAVYGVPHEGLTRQALHAWRVSLVHPVSRARVGIEAPLPDDLQNFTL